MLGGKAILYGKAVLWNICITFLEKLFLWLKLF